MKTIQGPAAVPILSTVFRLIGLGFLSCAGLYGLLHGRTLASYEPGSGTVIEVQAFGNGFRPVVQVDAPGAPQAHFESNIESNPPEYQVGEAVKVLYPPGHPESGVIDGFMELWSLALVLGLAGTVFLGIGTVLGIWARRLGYPLRRRPT